MKQNLDYQNIEVYVTRIFQFSAAHHLSGCCKRSEQLHGHNYSVHITLKGKLNEEGILIDFNQFESLLSTHVLYKLDHSVLNDVLAPLNPTIEILALYIRDAVQTCLQVNETTKDIKLAEITVYETESNYASVRV